MTVNETSTNTEEQTALDIFLEMKRLLKYTVLVIFVSVMISLIIPDGLIHLPYEDPQTIEFIESATNIGSGFAIFLVLFSFWILLVYRFRAKNVVESEESYESRILERDLKIVSTSLEVAGSAFMVLAIFGYMPV